MPHAWTFEIIKSSNKYTVLIKGVYQNRIGIRNYIVDYEYLANKQILLMVMNKYVDMFTILWAGHRLSVFQFL